MRKIGLCFTGQPYRLREIVPAAQWAEVHGYDSVWAAEDSWTGRDAITALTCIAYETSSLRVGTSLIGVTTRHPVLSAMTFNSLWELAPDRLILGVGLAHGWHAPRGTPVSTESPVATMRAAVESLRALTTGGQMAWGERSRGMMIPRPWFSGGIPPMSGPVPIYMGAVGPRMTRLAGEIGDGLLLEMEALGEDLPGRLEQMRAGARKSGRDPAQIDVVKLILAAPETKDGKIHSNALGWATKSVALLNDSTVQRLGWDPERVARIRAAWSREDWDGGRRLMSTEMVRSFIAAGSIDACLEILDETSRLGVTLPVLIPYGGDLGPVLELGAAYARA
ncbi:MAG: LLM class flavin-dependent oxidoreductase [Chloroflexi bacterium]|nr:LLM class flavin-dependent oxidoreductase [Chloroflexota bacterium]